MEQAFQGKPHRSVQLSSSSEAASLLEVLGDLAAANPDVKPAHLDHTALQASAAVPTARTAMMQRCRDALTADCMLPQRN